MSNAIWYWLFGGITGVSAFAIESPPIGVALIIISGGIMIYFDTRKPLQPKEAKK